MERPLSGSGRREGGGPGYGPARAARFRDPGKASLNRGLAALAVAAAGYLLGFLLPLAVSSGGTPGRRLVFTPIGGIISLFLAAMAIAVGVRTRRFIREMAPARRERMAALVDIERQSRLSAAGIALGVVSLIANPLLGFIIYMALR